MEQIEEFISSRQIIANATNKPVYVVDVNGELVSTSTLPIGVEPLEIIHPIAGAAYEN